MCAPTARLSPRNPAASVSREASESRAFSRTPGSHSFISPFFWQISESGLPCIKKLFFRALPDIIKCFVSREFCSQNPYPSRCMPYLVDLRRRAPPGKTDHERQAADMARGYVTRRGKMWYAFWVDSEGNTRSKSVSMQESEARLFLERRKMEVDLARRHDCEAVLFEQAAEEYIARVLPTAYKPSTVVNMTSDLRAHLIPFFNPAQEFNWLTASAKHRRLLWDSPTQSCELANLRLVTSGGSNRFPSTLTSNSPFLLAITERVKAR